MQRRPASRDCAERLRLECLESRQLLAVLANGEEVLDAIQVGGSETFEFQAEDLATVRVSVGETGLDAEPRVRVFDPRGVLVGESNGFDSALVELSANGTGTYTAVVTDNGDNDPMDYRVRVVTLPATPGLIPGRDEVLGNGEEFLSSVPVGAFNLHRFEANAADTVRFSVGETAGEAEPAFKVFGPDGLLLTSDFGNTAASVEFTAPAGGTYTAMVFEDGNSEALDYRVRVLTVPGVPTLLPGRDSPLPSGGEALSGFAAGGFNLHQFQVNAMGTFRIAVGETNTTAEPKLQVYDQAGVLVGSDSGFKSASVQFTPLVGGTFTAVVSDDADNDPLDYRVRVIPIGGSPVMLAGRDSLLRNGDEKAGTIALGAINHHQFTASAGETVRLAVGETSGNAEPRVQVFDEEGRLVIENSTAGSAVVQFTAPADALYTAIVSDDNTDDPFDYTARVVRVEDRPNLIPTRDSALANGGETLTSLGVGQLNLHTFQVNALGEVRVSVGETGGAGEPEIQVFGPEGEAIGANSGSASALVEFEATATGRYLVVVNDDVDDEPLDYRIRAISLPTVATQLVDRDTLTATTSASGAEIAIGAFNYHRFDAVTGEDARLTVTRTEGPGQPQVQVFDPTGAFVQSLVGGTEAVVVFRPTMDGVHTAIVSDAGNQESLTYDFEATRPAPRVAGDYNNDRVVDQADRAIWAAGFGGDTLVALAADGNGDGQVDAADYTIWRDNLIGPFATATEASDPVTVVASETAPSVIAAGPVNDVPAAVASAPLATSTPAATGVTEVSLLLYLAALSDDDTEQDAIDSLVTSEADVPPKIADEALASAF